MDFDFNLVLVPATLIFFVIWLLDKLIFKQRATRGRDGENAIISWAYDFWPVLAVVLIIRSFIVEPFNIPSESMVPTLQTGDFILVNKFSYGVRLPISNTKILDSGEPQRGEVAVFRYPLKPSINYIKRIVGLPGDHIVYDRGNLSINGQLVAKKALADMGNPEYEQFFTETLGKHTHTIRELNGANTASIAPFINSQANENGKYAATDGQHWEVKVPVGHYFAMGDNRDQSADSRFWGFVPEQNLSGRAFYVWMHKEPGWHVPSFARNGSIN
ncbi:signal peptidase I [Alkanindiges sp. WGS2144]|uniref:signal peptidase I n=1 Tax=Alkanindiges sp. WGS2144 TaxID=3366808 RepID=UPI0037507BBB